MTRVAKVLKHRQDVKFDQPEQHDGLYYEPHPNDPKALLRVCPVCHADVGEWCGSFGDIHDERDPVEAAKKLAALEEIRKKDPTK